VALVLNSAAGCHITLCQARGYLHSITALGRYQFILLGEQRRTCVNDLPMSLCMTAERPGIKL